MTVGKKAASSRRTPRCLRHKHRKFEEIASRRVLSLIVTRKSARYSALQVDSVYSVVNLLLGLRTSAERLLLSPVAARRERDDGKSTP
jgi:hypothetical protein